MLKLLLPLLCTSALHAESAFKSQTHIFSKNKDIYEKILSNDKEIDDISYLHLMSLRCLIDLKLEDFNSMYHHSNDLHNFIDGNPYLNRELMDCYEEK